MPFSQLTSYVRTQSNLLARVGFFVADRLMMRRAERHYGKMQAYLKGEKKILDIGVGAGAIHKLLTNKRYVIEGVDVENNSIYPDVVPTIYDGTTLPYKNKSFDVGIIIWVLHHCDDAERVLAEAKRVCKRVMVIENVYSNRVERTLTSWSDQLGNGEFYDHPYRTVSQWRETVAKYGWKMVGEREWYDFSYGFSFSHDYLFVIE